MTPESQLFRNDSKSLTSPLKTPAQLLREHDIGQLAATIRPVAQIVFALLEVDIVQWERPRKLMDLRRHIDDATWCAVFDSI